jgi:hypothetical protein
LQWRFADGDSLSLSLKVALAMSMDGMDAASLPL